MVEWVKMIFIDLSAQNIIIPWIYLIYNNDFSGVSFSKKSFSNDYPIIELPSWRQDLTRSTRLKQ